MLFCRVAFPALALLLAGGSVLLATPLSTRTTPSQDALNYFQSGSDKYAKGDLTGAISDYDQALKLNPKFAKAYYNRGLAKYDQGQCQRYGSNSAKTHEPIYSFFYAKDKIPFRSFQRRNLKWPA